MLLNMADNLKQFTILLAFFVTLTSAKLFFNYDNSPQIRRYNLEQRSYQMQPILLRNKRGLGDFFKRFWNIRKKVPFPFQPQTSLYPVLNTAQEYLLNQASNFYPSLFQLSQAIGEQAYPGYYQAAAAAVQQAVQNSQQSSPSSSSSQLNHQQYSQLFSESNSNADAMDQPSGYSQSTSQSQQNSYYYPRPQQQTQQSQSYPSYSGTQTDESKSNYYYSANSMHNGPIGTSPYTFHSNPSAANTFQSRPYGHNPGTIDVHQVLDQFIRSTGLSPHGDHDSTNKGYTDDKALSVKKLYSYPFYFSSSGDKPSIRRQSIDEEHEHFPNVHKHINTGIKRISQLSPPKIEPMITNGVPVVNEMHPKKLVPTSTTVASTMASSTTTASSNLDQSSAPDESSFIAKNAAALQEFLAAQKYTEHSSTGIANSANPHYLNQK